MEPRFRIVGNEVKEQSREKEPQFNYWAKMSESDAEDFSNRQRVYNEHLASLRTYIASPELKERFGDNEFGEKDIVVRYETIYNKEVAGIKYGDIAEVAYPVSQEQDSDWSKVRDEKGNIICPYKHPVEQESQVVSEVAEFLELWDMATTMHRREFMNEAKKHYTITKNK
jgi:hypothetical protein